MSTTTKHYAKEEWNALEAIAAAISGTGKRINNQHQEDGYSTWIDIYDSAETAYKTDKRGHTWFLNGIRLVAEEGSITIYRFHNNGWQDGQVRFTNFYDTNVIAATIRAMA